MVTYIARRLLMLIPVLIGVSFFVFLIAKVTPGDPVLLMLGKRATPDKIAALREQLHLNDPFFIQYGRFLWNSLHGDLGKTNKGQIPVLKEITDRFPSTLQLTLAATLFASSVGIPIGVLAARNRGKLADGLLMSFSFVGVSIPSFWLAILLILLFGVTLRWVSVAGGTGLKDTILPAFVLGLAPTAVLARMTRACMLEVLNEDYVRTARAKGLMERLVIQKHVLRNALIPVVTYLGLMFADLLAGALFIENVFARPGWGRLMVTAISDRDFPVIQGMVLFTATGYVLLNLVVDILYGVIDPRIGLS